MDEIFENHQIRSRTDRSWLLEKRIDGIWKSSDMWVEIVSLEHGELYVGGDIGPCVFSHYLDSQDPKDRVSWLGSKDTESDYVVKKALVGMDRDVVYKPFQVQLEKDLLKLISTLEEDGQDAEKIQKVRDNVERDMGEEVAISQFLEIFPDGGDYIGENFGKKVNPDIILAHHALRRLHSLFTTSDPALKSVQMRLSPQTLENFAAVAQMTGARSGADAVAYSADLARKLTAAVKAGKDIYIDDGKTRDRLFLPGVQS